MKLLPLTSGSEVTLHCDGRSLPAVVLFASCNRRSLIVGFDGILGGNVGAVPLLWEESTGYCDLRGYNFEMTL